jgi:50S ribosomal protein L16 3-hydroxylase
MNKRMLGGLTAHAFLRRHWQKRPLFVKQALPGFRGVIDARGLAAMAMRDDVESRIVERHGKTWNVSHGPFRKVALGSKDSALLVSGVNLQLSAADALLRRFAFIPQARLDDVMVSYATRGGGVGPHTDSYDVFLLQGPGRREWRVWTGSAKPEKFLVEAGDLLYLPPGLRHDGVAREPCFTYSIGFRAPRGAELGAAFLDWLHERGLPEARYRDPGLVPTGNPGRIPSPMLDFAERVLGRIRWTRADATACLGQYLTTPKQHVVFRPGSSRRAMASSQVRLDPRTQLLYSGTRFFINGELLTMAGTRGALLRGLADARVADGASLASARMADLIYRWQRLGYLHLESMA